MEKSEIIANEDETKLISDSFTITNEETIRKCMNTQIDR